MKQLSFSQLVITILLAMTTLHTTNASASVYRGKIELQVGEIYEVSAVPTSGYTASGSFSKSGTCFNITSNGSYYCKIKGSSAGKGTLTYRGTAARSGSWSTESYDYYWDIEVKSTTPGPTPNPNPNPDPDEEIDEPTDDWCKSGNYSISWFNKNKTDFTISTNKELAGMSYLVNNGYTEFENCTIKLTEDIDLSGKKWIQCKIFKGSFNGQGHKISGIYMGSDNDDQINFGFWQRLDNANISNLTLDGTAKYTLAKNNIGNQEGYSAGGLVGIVKGITTIDYCKVNINIYTTVEKNWYWNISIGGICGITEDRWEKHDCFSVKFCSFSGIISLNDKYKSGDLFSRRITLAGIAGFADEMYCCEVESPSISIETKTYGFSARAIMGMGSSDKTQSCRSIIDNISIVYTNHYNNSYGVCGIGSNALNCYSIIKNVKYSTKDSGSSGTFYYGGISVSENDEPKACFSNNDVVIESNRDVTKRHDGSTAFSYSQMKTSTFLDELNMYSILEMDGPVWSRTAGSYPYVAKLYETTGVKTKIIDRIIDSAPFYTLSGQRLAAPRKGLNILGGKKIIVK